MDAIRRVTASLLMCSLITTAFGGCTAVRTSYPAIAPAQSAFQHVERGDAVSLVLRDGRSLDIVVERIDGDALISAEGVPYRRSDITQMRHRSFSPLKTTLLVGGIVFGAFVVAGMMIASAIDSFWGG